MPPIDTESDKILFISLLHGSTELRDEAFSLIKSIFHFIDYLNDPFDVASLEMSSSVMTATPSSMMTMESSNKASHPNATALLALFREDDLTLQKYALETILYHCLDDGQWSTIVSILPDLEALAESTIETKSVSADQIQLTQLAAAVASKVFFYLEEPASALRLALLAGSYCQPLLQSSEVSLQSSPPKVATIEASAATSVDPYVTTLVRAALDSYVQARQKEWDREQRDKSAAMEEDLVLQLTVPQLQPLIDRIIESSCLKQQYQPAIGLCFEARDITKLQYVLQHVVTNVSEGIPVIRSILQYTLQLAMDTMDDRLFARLVMTTLATYWQSLFSTATPEIKLIIAYDLVHTLQCLNDVAPVAAVLKELIQTTDATASAETVDAQHLTALQIVFDLTDTGDQAFCQRVADALTPHRPRTEGGAEDIWERVFRVLTGGFVAELALSFRHKHSGADHAIMETLKRIMEDRSSGVNRSSVLHTNAIVAHSYLYAGTTYDAFLRNHLDWMKKASQW
jgi:26S proteasome regulatory subunit N2